MPNIKSAAKRVKTSAVSRLRNRSGKAALKTGIKKFEQTLEEDLTKAGEMLPEIVKELDHAATKGIIHKNAADRQKSRLMRNYAKKSTAGS